MTSKDNKAEGPIDRRTFIKRAAITGSAVLGTGIWGYVFYSDTPVRESIEKIYTFKDFRPAASSLYPVLAVSRGTDVEQMVRGAVEKLGGMSRFITPGDSVLIKPNAAWDRQPEQAANTNPLVVAAVVKLCIEARASSVMVTDVSINDPYRTFSRSGIEKATLETGGKILYPSDNDFVQTDMKGELLKVWPVFAHYHKVNKVINVPALKHHSLSKATLSMKNWYGVLGGRRNQLHQDINTSIADLASAVRPTLTVMDATRVLKRNGPTGGNLSDVSIENTIMAGLDEVAIDSWALQFLDLKADDIPYLKMGEERGIGMRDWKSLNVAEIQLG